MKLLNLLQDKHDDIVKAVSKNAGFEVLRQLIRRLDPENPNLRVQLQSRIFMLVDHKCKNFKEVIDRLALITRLVNDMREQCVAPPDSETLATVLYNNMDAICIAELPLAKIGAEMRMPRADRFEDLREYVMARQARERILMPQVPVKMDMSVVATGAEAAAAPSYYGEAVPPPPAPWSPEADRHLQPSMYHDPSPGPWTEVPAAHLDAMKGRKGDGKDRKPLQCHDCDGVGHPFRSCTSVYGAKDKPGQSLCELCGGKGHNKEACPSPGGGQFYPQKGIGKGDGKASGKGWGANMKVRTGARIE